MSIIPKITSRSITGTGGIQLSAAIEQAGRGGPRQGMTACV